MAKPLGPLTWPATMERVWDEDGVTCDGEFVVAPLDSLTALADAAQALAHATRESWKAGGYLPADQQDALQLLEALLDSTGGCKE